MADTRYSKTSDLGLPQSRNSPYFPMRWYRHENYEIVYFSWSRGRGLHRQSSWKPSLPTITFDLQYICILTITSSLKGRRSSHHQRPWMTCLSCSFNTNFQIQPTIYHSHLPSNRDQKTIASSTSYFGENDRISIRQCLTFSPAVSFTEVEDMSAGRNASGLSD